MRPCSGGRANNSRWLFILFLLGFSSPVPASTLSCEISSFAPAERSFKVGCTVRNVPATGKIELRFLDRFAGIERMSDRIAGLQIKDATGQRLLPEILGNGGYRFAPGNSAQITFEYEMRLARVMGASLDPGRYALTSSLGPHAGFLLLSDVLPSICSVNEPMCAWQSVRLKLHLPDEWQVATTEPESSQIFEVAEINRAIFFVGNLHTHTVQVEQMRIQVAVAEGTNLSTTQIIALAEAIARKQAAFIGSREQGNYLITLAPFPVPLTGLRSSALTRGRSVVMMLNPEPDAQRTWAVYQKHLAHEMFHLYLPEAFQARENFDWFWEGFTRYVALLTLNQLRLLSGREYLDEIGFEFEAYKTNPLRDRISLLAVSQGKFANAASYELLYRKGTLVAALYDLELRVQSDGKKTVLDIMRELYATYRQRDIGNQEVLAALKKGGKFESFLRDYIEGTREIDLEDRVKSFGLKVENAGGHPRLLAAKKLSGKQTAWLAALGH